MCGEEATMQPFVAPQMASYGMSDNIDKTGMDLLSQRLAMQSQGLPDQVKELMRQSVETAQNNALTSAKRMMRESLAGRNLPTGATVRAMGDLFNNKASAMANINKDIILGDYQAKKQNEAIALQTYLNMLGQSSAIAGQKNQFNLSSAGMQNQYNQVKYQADKANEFNWGQALGSLLGVGGDIFGGMASGGTGFFKG